jgi:transcriptional regulator with XRE-family HTH domain
VVPKSNSRCDVHASFATTFGDWRRKNKIPLKRIAKDLGVSISVVSSWESGQHFPTGCNFDMLVGYTGLPPCRLVCSMAGQCGRDGCLLAPGEMGRKRG